MSSPLGVEPHTNEPYAPVFYPEMPEPWRGLLARFLQYCEKVKIPSKEGGDYLILWDSQRYAIEEVFDGFSKGVHDFVILKGRQLGLSTVLWAFDLFWLTRFTLQAIYIADDEGNKEIHRDIIGQMYVSLPKPKSRGPWRQNNRWELNWSDQPKWTASRMMWAFANRRKEGQLGRSRGANYIHAEELDSWEDRTALGALTSARSEAHPRRAYFWVGTGQGYGQLYDLWDQAEHGVSSRPIFVGFWRRKANRVTREQRALWAAYGAPRPTPEELEWGGEVQRRYGITVTREQLAWWRYTKSEGKGINGDEAKMLQEHPWLPEQAFQASGSAFLGPQTCLRMRTRLRDAPPSLSFQYHWGERFDSLGDDVLVSVPDEAATLVVYEEPVAGGVYIVAADPAFGSSPDADRYALVVCRCFPDALVEVAKYKTPLGAMYQFAWVIAHLAGLYRVASESHLILEIGGPGRAVHEELERMAAYGYGLTKSNPQLQDVLGQIQHFLYRRADSMSGQMAWHFNTTTELRIQIMEQLRDTCERGALVVRSEDLVNELAALRRDEQSGRIDASGIEHDDLAFAAALAVHCWLQNIVPEIEDAVAPLTPPSNQPRHMGEAILRTKLMGLRQEDGPIASVGRPRAPGR